jgi:phosphatidylglycerol:prolipoprotein diacylglycerol transferase
LFPKLFEYSWLVIHTYGFLLAVAFLAGLSISARAARRQQVDPAKIYDLGLYIRDQRARGFEGALLITELGYYLDHPEKSSPGNTAFWWRLLWGFILAVIVGVTMARKNKLPVWKVADCAALASPWVSRLAAWVALRPGAATGKPTLLSSGHCSPILQPRDGWRSFDGASASGTDLRIACQLILFFILWEWIKRKRFDGQVFILYLASTRALACH